MCAYNANSCLHVQAIIIAFLSTCLLTCCKTYAKARCKLQAESPAPVGALYAVACPHDNAASKNGDEHTLHEVH